jgi:hypothetical protein
MDFLLILICIISIMKSRRMRWEGHIARMGEKRTAYMVLVGNAEAKRSVGRPRLRWVNNIEMGVGEIACGGVH